MDWIVPEWPAPLNVKAVASTRQGGISVAPFDSLNLGDHVGDSIDSVRRNRQHLLRQLDLEDATVGWLNQVHGRRVLDLEDYQKPVEADAAVSCKAGQVCLVMTADCLPILLCNHIGTQVAAVHAGWRGLASGIIEETLARFSSDSGVIAWMGPAIGPQAFEVGRDVYDEFVMQNSANASAFTRIADRPGKWFADIYALARSRLESLDVPVFGGGFCTHTDKERFFSYRRDGQTGRMASLIWLT